MIDRIEELLGSLAAEDEDEQEQEDVLTLPVAEEAVPASPRRDEGEAGTVGTDDRSGGRTAEEIVLERPGLIAGETVPERPVPAAGETGGGKTGDRSGGRTAGEIALERPGLIAGSAVLERPVPVAGETGDGKAGDRSGGRTAEEIWKDGPVWTVRSVEPEMDETPGISTAGRTVRAEEVPHPLRDGERAWAGLERAARNGAAGPESEGAGRSGPARDGLEQAGLKGLYRQTVQGLRPAAPALPPEQAGRTVRAQEPGSAASLAVDELDRAVRRDSRRYDGGMSIY